MSASDPDAYIDADKPPHWQARPEAGGQRGLRFLLWVARRLGRRVLHIILWPVSVYFVLVRAPERAASRGYLRRVLGRAPTVLDIIRHFHTFARVASDRVFFFDGAKKPIPVRFVIDPELKDVLAAGKPGIFLAAHFGSFEAARVLGPEMGGIRLRIVLDKTVNERFMEVLAELDSEMASLIIDSEQSSVDLGGRRSIAQKSGDWVGFLADRYRPGDRTTTESFLGAQARFPIGPYIIASVFKAPIIGAFCRLTSEGYEVHCEVLTKALVAPRGQRDAVIERLVEDYVQRLEKHVRATPFGWFNFFDFWADGQ